MSKKNRLLSAILVGILAASMLTGCGGGNATQAPATSQAPAASEAAKSEAPKSEAPKSEAPASEASGKDSLIVALAGEPPSVATCDHDSLIGVYMNILTYNGLTRIDNASLAPVMDLAESYVIENEVDWIFTLKQGVKFHNGEDFTADDVVATIEWAQTFPASSSYTGKIVGVEAVDTHTVKITTDGPYAGLLYDLGYHFNFMVPKSLIEANHDFNKEPIGTGAYILKDWNLGNYLAFEANEDYFDADRKAQIKNLQFNIIPEGASRTFALEAGEVDFIYDVATADVARLKADSKFEVAEVASVENFFLGLHKEKAPFDDVNVRNAINYGINREDIVTAALNGYGTPNYTCIPMGYPGDLTKGAASYDPEKAKEFLTQWGGDPASIVIPIICSNETKVAVATIIQSNLAELGITVEIVTTDTAAYLEATSSGNYVSYIGSWSPSNSLTYVQRYHKSRNDSSPGSLVDEEISEMVNEAAVTIDDAARQKLIEDIIEKANGLVPQPSLYQAALFRVYDAGLGGVVAGATGYCSFNEMYWK